MKYSIGSVIVDCSSSEIPSGATALTDAEYLNLIAAAPVLRSGNMLIQEQINGLELSVMIPRVTREFMLAIALKEALAAGYTEAQFIAVNIGYAKLKAQDDQIKVLRAQIV